MHLHAQSTLEAWPSRCDSIYDDRETQPRQLRDETSPGCRLEVRRYETLIELRRLWKRLDVPNDRRPQTFVLMIDEFFAGDLPHLVSRSHCGCRLILAVTSGRLPGFVSPGDLALRSQFLGWSTISVERNVVDAIRSALATAPKHAPPTLFWPAWRPLPDFSVGH